MLDYTPLDIWVAFHQPSLKLNFCSIIEIIVQQSWKKVPDDMWSVPLPLWRTDTFVVTAGRFLSLLVRRLDLSSAVSYLDTVSPDRADFTVYKFTKQLHINEIINTKFIGSMSI